VFQLERKDWFITTPKANYLLTEGPACVMFQLEHLWICGSVPTGTLVESLPLTLLEACFLSTECPNHLAAPKYVIAFWN
jgi:hypothetical protein